MLTRLTGLVLGLALMIAPAFADGACAGKDGACGAKDGAACADGKCDAKDGGNSCCGPQASACEKACAEWNWAEESQITGCGDHVCPNDLAMQEGKQPKRWAAGNPNYGLTVQNDCCWPDNVENQPNECRDNWELGAWYGKW